VAARRSTKLWLLVFAVAAGAAALDRVAGDRLGAFAIPFWLAAIVAATVLAWRALAALFSVVVHRLTLRLAFSYFLIGIVPIPLLAILLLCVGYVGANQILGSQVLREAEALAESEDASGAAGATVRVASGTVIESNAPWLPKGAPVPWAGHLTTPRALIVARHVWMAARTGRAESGQILLLPLDGARLSAISRRTGYLVRVEGGTSRSSRGSVSVSAPVAKKGARASSRGAEPSAGAEDAERAWARPPGEVPPSGFLDSEWVAGVRAEPAVASYDPELDNPVALFLVRTSPRVFFRQLFRQGMPELRGIVLAIVTAVAAALLFVYLIALIIAFVLVGSIARNVNRLTRAAQAIGRGDFSVRVNSRSRDQIGDLARSFDAMAASIERLLSETARKEKIEAELSLARAIQRGTLPESGGTWPGFRAVAHFEPMAEVGGDFYDVLSVSKENTVVVLGDVSGHGLPTALVAAAARSSIATFVELRTAPPEICSRLAARHRQTGSRRLYLTLALLAYDAGKRVATLTNAGHPAPYRISKTGLERVPLPAFPIGLLPQPVFPSREIPVSPGDRLALFTDGIVEATDASGEPFGYERLEQVLEAESAGSPEEIVQAVLTAVSAHVRDAPLEDDRTLVLLAFD
jgi:serine phosphatase RsbU (regulator of sigma subunit)